MFQLRPAAIEAEGLAAALSKHVEVLRRVHRAALEIELVGEPRLRPGVDEEVFRIAQEALHNAMRHSRAGRVAVRLEENGEVLRMSVSDDGVGFDPAAAELRTQSLGLTSMEERARELGGRLEIDSQPGRGTRIRLELGP